MNPFVVTLETAIVVMADTQSEAEAWVRANWYRISSDDLGQDAFSIDAEPMTYYPGNWDKTCLPYGATDDKKLGEVLENDETYQKKLKELRAIRDKHNKTN